MLHSKFSSSQNLSTALIAPSILVEILSLFIINTIDTKLAYVEDFI